ncbi:MAG: hypothetical protein WC517_00460 [Patescibacteria group bacterium]
MKKEIDWELHDIASKINAQVVTTTAVLNDTWRNELITLNLPNEALNKLWLETAFFGIFLLLKRFATPLGEEKNEFVNNAVRDAFLLVVPTCAFGDSKGENNGLKDYIASDYDRTLELYKKYQGIDVRMLFRDLVKDVFNSSEGSKIKFIHNSFGNRLKLKIAFIISALAGNKEFIEAHSNEVYLPIENLVAFANSATQAFAGISDNDIND